MYCSSIPASTYEVETVKKQAYEAFHIDSMNPQKLTSEYFQLLKKLLYKLSLSYRHIPQASFLYRSCGSDKTVPHDIIDNW